MDLEHFHIGLMDGKFEQAVQEVYNKFLLTDVGSARLFLVLPSVLPHPILSSLLTTLFNRWNYPSITLLPAPAVAAVAAGLRSALIVDIGWHETTATSIFELREIHTMRTTRAMKKFTENMGRHLKSLQESGRLGLDNGKAITFDLAQEIVSRLNEVLASAKFWYRKFYCQRSSGISEILVSAQFWCQRSSGISEVLASEEF
jgi:hypothetical protein